MFQHSKVTGGDENKMEWEMYADFLQPGVVGDTKGRRRPPPENEETIIEIQNPETMERMYVRAIVSSKAEDLPDGDVLWLYTSAGREDKPWRIKILKEVPGPAGESAEEIEAVAHRKLSLRERKGRMLSDLIKEREEREKEKKR